jgi:hypothetical protein
MFTTRLPASGVASHVTQRTQRKAITVKRYYVFTLAI